MKFIIATITLLIVKTAFAQQDWTTKYFDKEAQVEIIKIQKSEVFSQRDFQILDAKNVYKSYMTGLGRQEAIHGRKLIIKVRDHYSSTMFKINNNFASWRGTGNILVKFLSDDHQGNDIIEIFLLGQESRLSLIFLENFQRVTPNINSPQGYLADEFRIDLRFK